MNDSNNNLATLKKLGVKKIVSDTYISNDTAQAILDQDFKYFETSSKVLKFTKILNSYYNIDLSSWIEDYNLYCDANMPEKEKEKEKTSYTAKSIIKNNNYEAYFIIFIIIVAGIMLISIIPSTEQEKAIANNNDTVVIADKLKEALNKKPEITKYKVNKKTLEVIPLKKNYHLKQLTQEESIYDELNPEISDLLDRDIVIDLNKSILNIHNNDITIVSNLGRMWVGMIDIDTYDKSAVIIDGQKTFPIYNNTVFVTGHGHLTLISGGEEYISTIGEKQYFYYKNNHLIKLKKIEYLYINKGIEW